jgi:ribosomal protein L24E
MMNSIKSIDSNRNEFWKNEIGQFHRLDGPAIIRKDGTQYWCINDKCHRIDGPAIIWVDGTQAWYIDNKCHRLDGPAIINADGARSWYVNGKIHRLDGPAVIRKNGSQEWWIHDINITNEVNKWMKCNNISYPFDEEIQTLFKLRFL